MQNLKWKVCVGVRGNNCNSHPMAHPFLGMVWAKMCVCIVKKVAVRTLKRHYLSSNIIYHKCEVIDLYHAGPNIIY